MGGKLLETIVIEHILHITEAHDLNPSFALIPQMAHAGVVELAVPLYFPESFRR